MAYTLHFPGITCNEEYLEVISFPPYAYPIPNLPPNRPDTRYKQKNLLRINTAGEKNISSESAKETSLHILTVPDRCLFFSLYLFVRVRRQK